MSFVLNLLNLNCSKDQHPASTTSSPGPSSLDEEISACIATIKADPSILSLQSSPAGNALFERYVERYTAKAKQDVEENDQGKKADPVTSLNTQDGKSLPAAMLAYSSGRNGFNSPPRPLNLQELAIIGQKTEERRLIVQKIANLALQQLGLASATPGHSSFAKRDVWTIANTLCNYAGHVLTSKKNSLSNEQKLNAFVSEVRALQSERMQNFLEELTQAAARASLGQGIPVEKTKLIDSLETQMRPACDEEKAPLPPWMQPGW